MLRSRAALITMIVASAAPASAQRAPASAPDVVETIPPDDPGANATPSTITRSAAPVVTAPLTTPARSLHSFDLRGWVRSSAIVGLYRTGPSTPPLVGDLPHDRVTLSQQMFLRLRYAYGRSFEAVASGLLAFDALEQDARTADSFDLVNGAGWRTAFEPSLREAYVGAFWRRLDFRIGQQRIAWGRGDAFTPNDILDGYDLREQLIPESDAYHLPGFAARAGVDLGFGSLEAVVQPFFQPNRFDVYGGNWALVQPGAPLAYRALLGVAESGVSPTLHDALQPLLGQTELPPDDFTATSAGARFAVDVHRFDMNLYYQYGWDRTPKLEIDPAYATLLQHIDITKPIDPTPFVAPFLDGQKPVRASYVRRHHVGADVATTLGPLLLRAEGAFDSSRVLIARDDLHGVVVPVVQATAGIEYQPGELGKVVMLEAWYQHAFDLDGTQPLLFVQPDTTAVAALVRWCFFHQHLLVEARGVVGVQPFDWMVRGEVGYQHKALQVRAGAAVLDGDPASFGGYYRANTSAYLLIRYAVAAP